MNARKINSETGDLTLDADGRVARAMSPREQAKQKIRSVLKTFRGECFVNPEAGIPWFDGILGDDIRTADAARAEIRETVAALSEVESVDAVDLVVSGRNVSIGYTATLTDGTKLTEAAE